MASRWSDARGQTVTEYLLILGVMTAIIAAVTRMVIPAVAYVMVHLVDHLYIYLS